jgi:hypothetical protein
MDISSADRVLLPLATHVRDYEVRCQRAVAAAVRLAPKSPRQAATVGGRVAQRTEGSEVWVASTDGLFGGYVDEVVREPGGVVLRDYKTGLASVPGTPAADEAWVQLQLYAAIYAESAGVWPSRLEIVPLEGPPFSRAVEPTSCVILLSEARALLLKTNDALRRLPYRDAAEALARPLPDTCRRCEYRPTCPAYATHPRGTDPSWPNDILGTVVARHPLRNGRLLFEVLDVEGGRQVARGISDDGDRHPALRLLQAGARCGFFSLAGDRLSGALTETAMTVLVAYSGNSHTGGPANAVLAPRPDAD